MTKGEAIALARSLRKNQTRAEAYFWEKVRNRKLGGLKFNRQFVIEYAVIQGQSFYYIVDFYCLAQKLIVELDGLIHESQQEYDHVRQGDLEDLGYRVLRFSNDMVLHHWDKVEQRLLEMMV